MPLEQCRAPGRRPGSFDHFWAKLEHRHGKQDGTRAMVDVLLLGREHGFERLRAVIEQAWRWAYRMWPPSATCWSWSG
jgi:hypothetical protein